MVDSIEIPFVNAVKNLGVFIDDRLAWTDHVSHISKKINRSLFFLHAKCKELPVKVKKQLVTSIVLSHLEYCCPIFTNLSCSLLSKLDTLFHRAVRFIFSAKRDHNVLPFLKKLNWVPLTFRRLYFIGVQVFKILRFKKPRNLYETFSELLRPNAQHTRRLVPFNFPEFNSSTYKKSFFVTAVYFWNKIPNEIRNASSLPIFKLNLNKFLIDQVKTTLIPNIYNSNYQVKVKSPPS